MKKNLKFANRLLQHAKIPVTATAKYNVPVSKEVDIINKWKTLLVADKELATMRRKYQVLRMLEKGEGVDRSQCECRRLSGAITGGGRCWRLDRKD